VRTCLGLSAFSACPCDTVHSFFFPKLSSWIFYFSIFCRCMRVLIFSGLVWFYLTARGRRLLEGHRRGRNNLDNRRRRVGRPLRVAALHDPSWVTATQRPWRGAAQASRSSNLGCPTPASRQPRSGLCRLRFELPRPKSSPIWVTKPSTSHLVADLVATRCSRRQARLSPATLQPPHGGRQGPLTHLVTSLVATRYGAGGSSDDQIYN